jgi:hypothetical protein
VDFALTLQTPPATEPVSVGDLKNFLRVDTDDSTQDQLITAFIIAARQYVEQYTGLALCTQTWLLTLDNFLGLNIDRFIGQMPPWAALTLQRLPQLLGSSGLVISRGTLYLPKPPVQSVTQIQFMDPTLQTLQTLAPATYLVSTGSMPCRIMPSYGNVWPVTWEVMDAVQITFTAGYSNDGSLVPEFLKVAIRLLVSHWYEHREAAMEELLTEIPLGVKILLQASDYWTYR